MSSTVLKFVPPVSEDAATPVNQGYTKLDNATDLMVLAGLPNALVKPYLFLLSRRGLRVKTAHWGEVAAFCNRGQAQTFQALKQLMALGLISTEGGLYQVITGSITETHRKVVQKPVMTVAKNAVLDSVQSTPELRNKETKKEEVESLALIGGESEGTPAVSEDQTTESPTPDGATADAVQGASPSQDGLKNADQDGERVNDTGSEGVPPPAAPLTYRAALDVIDAAGLTPSWKAWIQLSSLRYVTQQVHAPIWVAWIQDGFARELEHEVAHIVGSGSYDFPWPALQKRMRNYRLENPAPAPPGTLSAPSGPTFQVGYTVRYPDGSTALVVSVQARGITTNHPRYADVPLGMLKTLEVVK